jgi:hypothetical protein
MKGWHRHCEEQSDEAIHSFLRGAMDCFAPLAMMVGAGDYSAACFDSAKYA